MAYSNGDQHHIRLIYLNHLIHGIKIFRIYSEFIPYIFHILFNYELFK